MRSLFVERHPQRGNSFLNSAYPGSRTSSREMERSVSTLNVTFASGGDYTLVVPGGQGPRQGRLLSFSEGTGESFANRPTSTGGRCNSVTAGIAGQEHSGSGGFLAPPGAAQSVNNYDNSEMPTPVVGRRGRGMRNSPSKRAMMVDSIRRFSVNPASFLAERATERRKSRSQSLASYKLSYYQHDNRKLTPKIQMDSNKLDLDTKIHFFTFCIRIYSHKFFERT